MLKKLLFSSLLFSMCVNAQLLESDTYASYTIGNVASDLTGVTPGQGGMYTYVATGGANSDFQIVNDATQGNVLQITGSSTAANTRFLWKNGLDTAWASRTVGNNVIQIELLLYTGGTTTSKNNYRAFLYDATGNKVLVGFSLVADTKTLLGVCNYDNAGTINNYSFNLGAGGAPINLPSSTWVPIKMSFNMTSGEVQWYAPGMAAPGAITGAAAGQAPAEFDLIVAAGTSNAASSQAKFDNYTVTAVATSNLSSQSFNNLTFSNFVAYPNPTSDFINLSILESNAVKSISLYDINGREVKSFSQFVDSIDVSDLTSGIYMLTVETENGKSTQKIVKE